jgi:uncharacterized protein YkwD
MRSKLYTSLLTGLVAMLVVPASAQALASRAQACPAAYTAPSAASMSTAAASTLCLVNYERAVHRLPALRAHGALASAAASHSRDMAARNFFSHNSPGGTSMLSRIKAARYLRPNTAWGVGENLGWGTREMSTPAYVVSSWMRSPGHRANILKRSFREVGVGVAVSGDKVLYTADFGFRR